MGRLARVDEGFPPLAIREHYSDLDPEDVTTLYGIPVTAPARTLLDIATEISESELAQAVGTALERGLTTRDGILGLIARYPDYAGRPRLSSVLEG